MSIFGKLDAATVSTNPFFIEAGEYLAEVTNAEIGQDRNGDRQMVFEYTITDEDSAYNGNKTKEYFPLVAEDMTAELFETLPADDKKRIRNNNAKLKSRLCGYNERNKGFGVDENDLNEPGWDPAVIKGTKVTLGISNGSNGQYTNVKFVTLAE